MYNELERKKLEFNGKSEIYQMELEIKKEAKKQELKNVQYETEQQALDNVLETNRKRTKQIHDS
jgi:hypothetical protein